MLLKVILNYILGYLNIKVEGYFVERFINICISKKILLWNMKRAKNTILYANIGMKDFKKIRQIARKTHCKVQIKSKKGMPYILHKYKKRKIFGMLLIIIISGIIALSNFIWNIEIIGTNKIHKDELMLILDQQGLKLGTRKGKVDTKKIINNVRLKNDNIAWMGINIEGTNVKVEVKESEEKPDIVDSNEYCNIISEKTGVITKINAQNGTANVKVGDIVKPGTLLVKGWMEGKYTGTRYVHAIADIEAKIWYSKKNKVYFKQEVSTATSNTEQKYTININNFKINLYKTLSKFENYDTINESKKVKLFSNFYLPIELIKTTNFETRKETVIYTEQQLIEIATMQIEQELLKEIKKEQDIINKQVNVYNADEYIEVEVIYEVLEKIGTQEKIIF